jgi:hypothetical protein
MCRSPFNHEFHNQYNEPETVTVDTSVQEQDICKYLILHQVEGTGRVGRSAGG